MINLHLIILNVISIHFEMQMWAFIILIFACFLVIVFVSSSIKSSARAEGFNSGVGKIHVLTTADIGRIFLVQWVLIKDDSSKKEDNIGVAYMREDNGNMDARWYQLPYGADGKPVWPTINRRCMLTKGEKAEYCHFQTLDKV